MMVSNNIGNQNIWKYENFKYQSILVDLQMCLTIGCSGRLVPEGYKYSSTNNYDESVPLAKYPVCGWSSDAFTNWITENGVNIASQIILGIGGAVLGVATGGVGLALAGSSIAGTVANLIGQFNKANLLPSIQGGQSTGDINFSSENNDFYIHHMRAKLEYLKIIDDYFTRFGYKINRLKVPNITGRTYWNYVEIGASEDIGYGDVPTTYMEIINNAARKGVTIWHNHTNIGNYNLSNTIVT